MWYVGIDVRPVTTYACALADDAALETLKSSCATSRPAGAASDAEATVRQEAEWLLELMSAIKSSLDVEVSGVRIIASLESVPHEAFDAAARVTFFGTRPDIAADRVKTVGLAEALAFAEGDRAVATFAGLEWRPALAAARLAQHAAEGHGRSEGFPAQVSLIDTFSYWQLEGALDAVRSWVPAESFDAKASYCRAPSGGGSERQAEAEPPQRDSLPSVELDMLESVRVFEYTTQAPLHQFSDFLAESDSPRAAEELQRLGPFRMVRVLGRGAFTTVYLAFDETSVIRRTVAIKVPRSATEIQRLRQEALVWESLSSDGHPNILRFEDLKQVGDDVFFVMEHMEDGNIEEALRPLDGERRINAVIRSLEPICAGLAFIHGRDMIHGDIKPENILLGGGGRRVKLADFGLSRGWNPDDATPDGTSVAGSMMFLPPESFSGVRTPALDVYSLGVTLYYLLTGEYPFQRFLTDLEQLQDIKLAFRPRLRAKVPSVPTWLEQLVVRCMEPDPEQRFRDGRELLDQVRLKPVVMTVGWDPKSQTAGYDLDIQGIRSTELLHKTIASGNVEGLCDAWNRLGTLALDRAGTTREERPRIGEQIREALQQIAEFGPRFTLDDRIPGMLAHCGIASLWLRCDPRLAALPWELFKVGVTYACIGSPMSRWPMLLSAPASHRTERRETIRVLIVADPTNEVELANQECRSILRVFTESSAAARFKIELSGPGDSAFHVRTKIARCDILHFIGHAYHDDRDGDLATSGLLLKGTFDCPTAILTARELGDLWKGAGPILVFANSCNSAKASQSAVRRPLQPDAAMGLAQAFLSSGVENYVGTVWEAPDVEATAEFAVAFYRELLAGSNIGRAMHVARTTCFNNKELGECDLTWARYIHCGDPSVQLFPGRRASGAECS